MNKLIQMTEIELRAWILARLRAEGGVDESRLESPGDVLVRAAVEHPEARKRIEEAVLGALLLLLPQRIDLTQGPDARAVRHLAEIVDELQIQRALCAIHDIALRGSLGVALGWGADGALDFDAEESVLGALLELQVPDVFYPLWEAAWERDLPKLWPVISAGLRTSNPHRALGILGLAAERALLPLDDPFPLGEIMWSLANDPGVTPEQMNAAMEALPYASRLRCLRALEEMEEE